jgi:hypothetical protein
MLLNLEPALLLLLGHDGLSLLLEYSHLIIDPLFNSVIDDLLNAFPQIEG